MRHPEREHSNGAEHRDTVVRTVVFAFVTLTAWWCCTNAASAEEAAAPDPAPTDGTASPSPAAPAPSPASLTDLPVFSTLAADPPPAPPPAALSTAPPASPSPAILAIVTPPTASAAMPAPSPAHHSATGDTHGASSAWAAPTSIGDLQLGGDTSPAPRPADRSVAEGGAVREAEVVVEEPGEVVVTDPAEAFLPGAVQPEPVLVPMVVLPLVDAVSPVVAPVGEVVSPILDAVTTPLVPVVQAVVPVVDQLAGPVLAPVAAPLVAVVAPVVEQVGTAVAPLVELAAPVVVPVVRPVVAIVAPLAAASTTSVSPTPADPPTSLRHSGRPGTAAFATDPLPPMATAGRPLAADAAPAASGHRTVPSTDIGESNVAVEHVAAVLVGGLAPDTPSPLGGPSRPAVPVPRAAVLHGGSDAGQRDPRLVAVLAPAADVPSARLSALSGVAVTSPLVPSGGRPPVTPD